MSTLPDPTTPLDKEQAAAAFAAMLDGGPSDEEIRDFLNRLSDRGETAIEIAAAATAMRERMIAITAPEGAIDVCGTGGDGLHTVNVSTAVAIVVAACGVPVAKHGNRAASSKAGGADTLEALGVRLDITPAEAEKQLADLGLCFLFAQRHHPALARLAPIRKAIGRRTIFNLTGPLANPARVKRQIVGIARPDYAGICAEAMRFIGMTHAMCVAGEDNMDELSLCAANRIAELSGDEIRHYRIAPEDVGLPRYPHEALRGGDAAFNAAALRRLLEGETGAYRDAVLLNAAGALIVAEVASDWRKAMEEAAEVIDKGLANALLNCWIAWK
ncbi:MAG: anthranilate phosphoribosyltransferase [Sphingomonadales bacterium]|nr:MAG: anthranilate phosphoribosyltransferase [Sphingomonadales bacterium]TNF03614.1 MAG: anthranilate phosphoribosyltransferase [Sphingomonadales bacterium]